MFNIDYSPNPKTHTPNPISTNLYNCNVCGGFRNPGKNFGKWPCSEEIPCPCCLRKNFDAFFDTEL